MLSIFLVSGTAFASATRPAIKINAGVQSRFRRAAPLVAIGGLFEALKYAAQHLKPAIS